MKIHIITTGGTIDKIYFDEKSSYEVGEPQVARVLRRANVTFDYEVIPLLRRDSLQMMDEDRRLVCDTVSATQGERFVITHGTDTMVDTALALQGLSGKVVVLTGAMQPARFRETDAGFNIACAVTAVQTLPEGVYIAMNGQIFDPTRVRKNVERDWFEEVSPEEVDVPTHRH